MTAHSDEHLVVAIDGPAASGKSSVARALAKKLGFVYVNSGAMYRAVTWYALEKGVPTSDAAQVVALMDSMKIECGLANGESTITINGVDPGPFLNSEAVNHNVSNIASIAEVRKRLVALQQEYAGHSDIVMEGRDIGSVVFPHTPSKFYIDASLEVRARRRENQGLQDEVGMRDKRDSSRRASPLVIAEDAHVI
ncbi:MAG TPA: (d)CMP kinase, partial [Chthoniobacteraceae bacterium]|nr:(d)CMP kinase [Chthoniobacteraceae bacterium]